MGSEVRNPLTPTNKLYSKLILLNNIEICAAWSPTRSPGPTLNTDGRLPNVAVTPATATEQALDMRRATI